MCRPCRYSARLMTRRAKVSMLIRSMGEMSCPIDVFAASSTSRALSSSPGEQLWISSQEAVWSTEAALPWTVRGKALFQWVVLSIAAVV